MTCRGMGVIVHQTAINGTHGGDSASIQARKVIIGRKVGIHFVAGGNFNQEANILIETFMSHSQKFKSFFANNFTDNKSERPTPTRSIHDQSISL